ncbi:hypothetical protein PHMEG_0004222 [Phytophthora megakarya]|uniref:Uncharacterized protein n=1 Tax=Phytophthora megakarya TaxID=4795 RepID=A0A225WUF2_9STRA|nr:hypothetical protein PHMEG_0004222 [Phytophthora megakarya]
MADGGSRARSKDAFFTKSRGIPVAPEFATALTIDFSGAKNANSAANTASVSTSVKTHLQARRDLGAVNHGYLFVDLSAEKVSSALKATATRAGLEKSMYSSHSLKSGDATALKAGRVDSLSIKLLGRWVPHCYEE